MHRWKEIIPQRMEPVKTLHGDMEKQEQEQVRLEAGTTTKRNSMKLEITNSLKWDTI